MREHPAVDGAPESTVESIADLLEFVRHVAGLWNAMPWFRGQAVRTWSLVPAVFRETVPPFDETRLTQRFRSRAPTRAMRIPSADDHAGWLGLMQHHRLPTRLLDWSESAMTALYFACEEPEHHSEDGAIFALNPYALTNRQGHGDTIHSVRHPAVAKHFACAFNGSESDASILPTVPDEVDLRMTVQQAMFTIHGTTRSLDEDPSASAFIRRARIPSPAKGQLLIQFRLLGISRSSLFPDLENLALDLSTKQYGSRGPRGLPLELFADSVAASAVASPAARTRGWQLANDGRLREAREEFERAVAISATPATLTDLGRFEFRVGRTDLAKQHFKYAEKLALDNGDLVGRSGALLGLGNLALHRGEVDTAEDSYREALRINEGIGRGVGIALAYRGLGLVFERRGQYEQAEELQRKALHISQALETLEGVAGSYYALGTIRQRRGDLEGAETFLRMALEIFETTDDVEGVTSACSALARILAARSDLAGAESLNRRVLLLGERTGMASLVATAYSSLGELHRIRGNLEDARTAFLAGLATANQLGDERLKGIIMTKLSQLDEP